MYRTLFSLAGLAIVAWLPLILVPRWKWTRRLAQTAVFPFYLSVLYLIGITAVLMEMGPGIMQDFGDADGVLALLRSEGLALVAWIHILAFDQLVGVGIYRDNMRLDVVPMPVQSVILFLTLMFGPVGFVVYYLARVIRRPVTGEATSHGATVGAGSVERAAPTALRFSDVARERSVIAFVLALWKRERLLVGIAGAAFVLAGVCALTAALHGAWHIPPEGKLLDAFKFEVGVGTYFLTLALLLPFAGMSARGRRRWLVWTALNAAYFISIETVQAIRGLDPRFTAAGGSVDVFAGRLFGVSAFIIVVLFAVLVRGYFRRDVLVDHPPLRNAVRYGVAAIAFSFGVGIIMSVLTSRFVGSGNLMPVHAAGFHGLQAVPLVALLAGWSTLAPHTQMRLTHAAGIGWLLVCVGALWQAIGGHATLTLTTPLLVALAGGVLWLACLGVAAFARMRAPAMAGTASRMVSARQ